MALRSLPLSAGFKREFSKVPASARDQIAGPAVMRKKYFNPAAVGAR